MKVHYPRKEKVPRKWSLSGFTLTELLIVIVIIGILLLLAVPNLMPLISRTKSLEAKMQLKHLYTLQKSHFMMYSTYTMDLEETGFEHELTVDEGGNANFLIEIQEADRGGFIATATALVDFDGDGTLSQWEINEDQELIEVVKD